MTKLSELEVHILKATHGLKDAIEQAEGWSNALSGGWPAMETLLKNLKAALELTELPSEVISALRDEAEADDAMRAGFDEDYIDGFDLADFCGEHPTNWKHDPWGQGLYPETGGSK